MHLDVAQFKQRMTFYRLSEVHGDATEVFRGSVPTYGRCRHINLRSSHVLVDPNEGSLVIPRRIFDAFSDEFPSFGNELSVLNTITWNT